MRCSPPTSFRAAAKDFVLVRLDYLPGEDNQLPERLPQEPPAPHVAWKVAYDIKGFPTVFLADATGRPYAVTGSSDKGPKEYLEHLSALRQIHAASATLASERPRSSKELNGPKHSLAR